MKVLITGPESSGKSTLARSLAWALDGRYVAEQARAYLAATGGVYRRADLTVLLGLQRAAERAAGPTGYRFCDTGPFNLAIWSAEKYGEVAGEIRAACRSADYDLILLCAPDLPYVPDPLRESPDPGERRRLYDRFTELLPPALIRPISGHHRQEQALKYVLGASS